MLHIQFCNFYYFLKIAEYVIFFFFKLIVVRVPASEEARDGGSSGRRWKPPELSIKCGGARA